MKIPWDQCNFQIIYIKACSLKAIALSVHVHPNILQWSYIYNKLLDFGLLKIKMERHCKHFSTNIYPM